MRIHRHLLSYLAGLFLGACQMDASVSADPRLVPVVVHLKQLDGVTRVVQSGFLTLPQLDSNRVFVEVGFERIPVENVDPDTVYLYRPKILADQRVCMVNTMSKQLFCYDHRDRSWSKRGSGKGKGPGEMQAVNAFAFNGTGAAVMYDGQTHIAKWMDGFNQEAGRALFLVDPPNDAILLDDGHMVAVTHSQTTEPLIARYTAGSRDKTPLVYMFRDVSSGEIPFFIGIKSGFIHPHGDHFIFAHKELGFFSKMDMAGNIVYTRSLVNNRHDRPVVVPQDESYRRFSDKPQNVFRAHMGTIPTFFMNFGSSQDHVFFFVYNDRNFFVDAYRADTGEYDFTFMFRNEGQSVTALTIRDDLIATTSGQGELFLFRVKPQKPADFLRSL